MSGGFYFRRSDSICREQVDNIQYMHILVLVRLYGWTSETCENDETQLAEICILKEFRRICVEASWFIGFNSKMVSMYLFSTPARPRDWNSEAHRKQKEQTRWRLAASAALGANSARSRAPFERHKLEETWIWILRMSSGNSRAQMVHGRRNEIFEDWLHSWAK